MSYETLLNLKVIRLNDKASITLNSKDGFLSPDSRSNNRQLNSILTE